MSGVIPDDFGAFADLIPEGAIPTQGIRILCVLDADGNESYTWQLSGTDDTFVTIGLLEWTKLELVATAKPSPLDRD